MRYLIFVLLALVGTVASAAANEEFSPTGSWQCTARSTGFDKHGVHYGSGTNRFDAKDDVLATCQAFHVATQCELMGCGTNTDNAGKAATLLMSGPGKYLGCTVDAQQCGMRATRYGYSHYHAESYYGCANASKFGCWGVTAGATLGAAGDASFEGDANEDCARFTKQILCVSYNGCSWVNGHCVND